MEPTIEQIMSLFPDIEPADIQRIMSFLGYTTPDIYDPNPPFKEIAGITYFIQSPVVEMEIDEANNFTL